MEKSDFLLFFRNEKAIVCVSIRGRIRVSKVPGFSQKKSKSRMIHGVRRERRENDVQVGSLPAVHFFFCIRKRSTCYADGQNTLLSWPEDKPPDDGKLKVFVAGSETIKEKKPGFTYKWELATVICGISNLSW